LYKDAVVTNQPDNEIAGDWCKMKALVGAALIALITTGSAHAERKIHLVEVYLHDCQIADKTEAVAHYRQSAWCKQLSAEIKAQYGMCKALDVDGWVDCK
jgi:hypothetical protein